MLKNRRKATKTLLRLEKLIKEEKERYPYYNDPEKFFRQLEALTRKLKKEQGYRAPASGYTPVDMEVLVEK